MAFMSNPSLSKISFNKSKGIFYRGPEFMEHSPRNSFDPNLFSEDDLQYYIYISTGGNIWAILADHKR